MRPGLVAVDVAQSVEHWTVAPVVAGSSPVIHPIPFASAARGATAAVVLAAHAGCLASSTSRTFTTSASMVNGFWRNAVSPSRTPWRRTASSV